MAAAIKQVEAGATTAKTLFQLDYSFLGKNEFSVKAEERTTNTAAASTSLKTNVYCIRLNRLIKTDNRNVKTIIKSKFRLKRTRDLVHTICAMYDNSLPDIGPASIYDCICSPKSFTICVVKDEEEAATDEMQSKDDLGSLYGSKDDLRTVEDLNEETASIFTRLFSDDELTENEEAATDGDDEGDSANEQDFTYGVKSFLETNRGSCSNAKPNVDKLTGGREPLLKSLIACATIQKTSTFQLPGQDEWIIDLELMSVRPKYRGLSIGKYLLNLIQNKSYVGAFDAIVTSSDLDAIKFYEKYGFNIDPILNSKYKFIGDIWTNTTKMCYIPPYCQLMDKHQAKLKDAFGQPRKPLIKSIEHLNYKNSFNEEEIAADGEGGEAETGLDYESACIHELTHMETDFKRWQKLMFSAYQSQAQIFFKLKQEITNLKIKLSAKESLIDDLKFQNNLLSKKNVLLRMEMGKSLTCEPVESSQVDDCEESGGADLDKLIAELKVLSKAKHY